MTYSRLVGAILAVAALLSVVFATPATAQRTSSVLTLTLQGAAGALSTVRLVCDPPGGSHPRPADACAAIADADGDLSALEPLPGFCTMEYRPVTATARGTWQGQTVRWRHVFSNPCTVRTATGPVFTF